jgi:hypothetical protein
LLPLFFSHAPLAAVKAYFTAPALTTVRSAPAWFAEGAAQAATSVAAARGTRR